MAIPETQLDTWAHQGSITGSSSTYATVKTALEASTAGYAGGDYSVFLQGSYGNDTNIYADSDVDVVIQLNSTIYYDDHDLPEPTRSQRRQGITTATYSHAQFKLDVAVRLPQCLPQSGYLGGQGDLHRAVGKSQESRRPRRDSPPALLSPARQQCAHVHRGAVLLQAGRDARRKLSEAPFRQVHGQAPS